MRRLERQHPISRSTQSRPALFLSRCLLVGAVASLTAVSIAEPAFAPAVTNAFGINFTQPTQGVTPVLVDIDGDGDLDLYLGFRYSYGHGFMTNTGSPVSPVELCSCGLIAKQRQPIQFNSNPSGATVVVDDATGKTPVTLWVRRKSTKRAIFTLEGYEQKNVQITNRMNTNGVLDIIGFFFILVTPLGFLGQGDFTIEQTSYEATLNPVNSDRADSSDRKDREDREDRSEGEYAIDDLELSATLISRAEDLRVTAEVSSKGSPEEKPRVRCYMLRKDDESEVRSELMHAKELDAGNWEMTATFSIPADFKTGEYIIRVKEMNSGSEEEKEFRVWE